MLYQVQSKRNSSIEGHDVVWVKAKTAKFESGFLVLTDVFGSVTAFDADHIESVIPVSELPDKAVHLRGNVHFYN
jgi:hypothetical protein